MSSMMATTSGKGQQTFRSYIPETREWTGSFSDRIHDALSSPQIPGRVILYSMNTFIRG